VQPSLLEGRRQALNFNYKVIENINICGLPVNPNL
jgi:hypothetical protein